MESAMVAMSVVSFIAAVVYICERLSPKSKD